MYEEFRNKVVLVTGSSSGIGEQTVILFSSFDAKVVIIGRNEQRINNVANKCEQISPSHHKPLTIVADLTKDEQVKSIVEKVIEQHGRIDILVNNAALAKIGLISDENIMQTFDETMNLNLRPVVLLCHFCLPYLIQTKGSIINISSNLTLKPKPSLITHGMAKAGLDFLTKTLALEYGPKGVRVNNVKYAKCYKQFFKSVLSPGIVDTPMFDTMGFKKEETIKVQEEFASKNPLGRVAESSDVANTILFLASNLASYLTGAIIPVDGGYTIA